MDSRTPPIVQIFTCAEVLMMIFGQKLNTASIDEAKKAFEEWLVDKNALFYPGCPHDPDVVCQAALVAVTENASIVVIADLHEHNDLEDDYPEDED